MATPGARSGTLENERQKAVWQVGTVSNITVETPHVKSFRIELPGKLPHLAGQHLDLRLTAPDGYQAARSYSIASPPGDAGAVEITVQMLPDGEVSGYLDTEVKIGDQLEVKSPIGYHFIWRPEHRFPVTLIGGGSGVVPLMSMLRHHRQTRTQTPMQLLYSVREQAEIIYKRELLDPAFMSGGRDLTLTLTDQQPAGWDGYRRRIDRAMLEAVLPDRSSERRFYICGPTPMVEAVANLLTGMGFDAAAIKTERFGPTGTG
jgi:ferredoxin-NADP reductase